MNGEFGRSSSSSLIEVLPWHLLGGAEENHKNPHSGQPEPRPKF
jgi:hypothetical protein